MRSLLLVAHGSRREASNNEIRERTNQLRSYIAAFAQPDVDAQFEYVDCAFLELASPSIPEGIGNCVTAGSTEIIVLPYFLSAGRHVHEDIPNEVNSVKSQFPEVSIHISDYLGASSGVCELLLSLAMK